MGAKVDMSFILTMFLDYVLLEPLVEGGWEEIKFFIQKWTLEGTNDTRWNDFVAFKPWPTSGPGLCPV